jgi:hypothetical protein
MDHPYATLPNGTTGKFCARCSTLRPLDEFYRNTKQPDGRTRLCYICMGQRMKDYAANAAVPCGICEKIISPYTAVNGLCTDCWREQCGPPEPRPDLTVSLECLRCRTIVTMSLPAAKVWKNLCPSCASIRTRTYTLEDGSIHTPGPDTISLYDVKNWQRLAQRLASRSTATSIIPPHLVGTPRGVPCIVWSGATSVGGYGKMGLTIEGKHVVMPVHRIPLLLRDECMPRELNARHLCHNKLCVEVAHLAWGTDADNVLDTMMLRRWEQRTVAPVPLRLTVVQVEEIRRVRAKYGISYVALARLCGVSRDTIRDICTGRTWKNYVVEPAEDIAE